MDDTAKIELILQTNVFKVLNAFKNQPLLSKL